MTKRNVARLRLLVAVLGVFWLAVRAAAQPADLTGWWRGQVEHGGERAEFYLHLESGERERASFSVPVARMHEAPIGAWVSDGREVRFPGIGWSLAIVPGKGSLQGTLPQALVPHYRLPLRLERASAPPPMSPIVAAREAPAPAWRHSLASVVWAGLAYDPRRQLLFVADDDGRVTALHAGSGQRVWSVDLGTSIRATPTLEGSRLYVATDHALFALETRTGLQLWGASFGAQLEPRLPSSDPKSRYDHYSGSAALSPRLVVVPGRDGCVHAFRKSGGRKVWSTCIGHLVTATPAIRADGVFFGAFDGIAYALSLADGSVRWRVDTHGPITRDAVISGDQVLFGSRSYELVALDSRTGKRAWSRYFWFSWIDSPPVVEEGVVYVGSSDLRAVQALDAPTGRGLWSTPVPGWSWPRPALAAHSIYVGVIGNTGYFQPRKPALAAIDRRAGGLRWLFRPDDGGTGMLSGFASAPVVDGNRVFAVDLSGNVYALIDR